MKKISSIERVTALCAELEQHVSGNIVVVDVAKQTLALYNFAKFVCEWRISSSKFGVGNKENSFMTPVGLHRVEEKIGTDAPMFAIFRARVDTGQICGVLNNDNEENLILTRILRLRGLEPNVNAGEKDGVNIDSYDRYVYIHGTNREDLIGQPASHGCICMKNADVAALYDMIDVGTLVYIDGVMSA